MSVIPVPTDPGTATSETGGILFYGADWCPDSRRSRRLLDELGLPYRFVDLDQDEAASAWVQTHARGNRTTPTIVLGNGAILVEPSNDDLKAALRAANSIDATAA